MKWKPKDLTKWHNWFAWYPVIINSSRVWLETVSRKGNWIKIPGYEGHWLWEYRLLNDDNKKD